MTLGRMRAVTSLCLRMATVLVAVGSPIASHIALALGQGYGVAMALAAAQAVAGGVWIASSMPGRRWLGVVAAAVLLGGLGVGGRASAQDGLLAAAGLSHAMLYLALLAFFAETLRPGRISLVTSLARRLNPAFHEGMIPYTRGVTKAWCWFFGGQLAASGLLLVAAPGVWGGFVTTAHAPMVIVMGVGEYLVRRWRWRGEHYTSLADTIRGVRRIRAEGAIGRGGGTSLPGEGCRGDSGSGTRRPPRAGGSGSGRDS